MRVAQETALLSTCTKKYVGAVLVRSGRILSTGYNGAPSKITHCTKESCLRPISGDNIGSELCKGVHAEINTIIQCALHGIQIGENSKIFCTHFPCMSCTKTLINIGIKDIIFKNDYEMDNIEKFKLINEANIDVYKFSWAMKTDEATKLGVNKNIYIMKFFDVKKHINNIKKGSKETIWSKIAKSTF